jgi:hypothetical protein
VTSRSLVLGIDIEGRWVQFVPKSEVLIAAEKPNMLFFLPLLDINVTEFVTRATSAGPDVEILRAKAYELAQAVVSVALRERASPYIEKALMWLPSIPVTPDIKAALGDLARSKRGTQKLRQLASSLLRRD